MIVAEYLCALWNEGFIFNLVGIRRCLEDISECKLCSCWNSCWLKHTIVAEYLWALWNEGFIFNLVGIRRCLEDNTSECKLCSCWNSCWLKHKIVAKTARSLSTIVVEYLWALWNEGFIINLVGIRRCLEDISACKLCSCWNSCWLKHTIVDRTARSLSTNNRHTKH